MHRDPPHYLSKLKTTRVPRRLAYFDVQSKQVRKGRFSERTWQCGTLGTTHWTAKSRVRRDDLRPFDDPCAMWTFLDSRVIISKRTVCFTYDLPEQLRTSQALIHLPELGWKLETIVLEPGASWALWRDGKRSLLMCDLKSWTPYEWERINEGVGYVASANPDTPSNLDRAAVMSWNRCRVIRTAVGQILDWIEAENLGSFKPTGSGQSYGAFRRRYLADKILVHDDIQRLDAERKSMWSGRTEAWRHGQLDGGPFIELDMRAAYCRIAAECAVPTVALGETYGPRVGSLLRSTNRYAYLCHVQVETETPIVPASSGAHTIWPVGKFDTWVWDPELRLLDAYAGRVHITKAYKYRTAPALAGFATDVLAALDAPSYEHGTMPVFVMKHWSRCLVGRFGLRYRSWIPFCETPDPELMLVTYIDYDDNSMTDMLCVGHDMLLLGEMTESVESVPQIPAWIMSECRRRLWETMNGIGLERVVYVDTDSIIVDTQGDTRYARNLVRGYARVWSHKQTLHSLTIHGPRNLIADSDRRVSGLPLGAVQTGRLQYSGEVLQSIKQSMRHGQLDRVTTVPRKFMFTAPDIRRGHNPGGSTYAFRLGDKTTEERL